MVSRSSAGSCGTQLLLRSNGQGQQRIFSAGTQLLGDLIVEAIDGIISSSGT
jgi:hypothetical protein